MQLLKMSDPLLPRKLSEFYCLYIRCDLHFSQLGKLVALDCEYVGGGERGEDDLLARVSIVDEVYFFEFIMITFL